MATYHPQQSLHFPSLKLLESLLTPWSDKQYSIYFNTEAPPLDYTSSLIGDQPEDLPKKVLG